MNHKQVEEGRRFIDELLAELQKEHDDLKNKEVQLLKFLSEVSANLTLAKHKLAIQEEKLAQFEYEKDEFMYRMGTSEKKNIKELYEIERSKI